MPNPFIPITKVEDKWKSKPYSHRAINVFICPLCGWDLKVSGIQQSSDFSFTSNKKVKWAHIILRCGKPEVCKFEVKIYFRRWKENYKSSPRPMNNLQKYKVHKNVRTNIENKWEHMGYFNKCFAMRICPECGEKLIATLFNSGLNRIPQLKLECTGRFNYSDFDDLSKAKMACGFVTTAIISLETCGLIYARLMPHI